MTFSWEGGIPSTSVCKWRADQNCRAKGIEHLQSCNYNRNVLTPSLGLLRNLTVLVPRVSEVCNHCCVGWHGTVGIKHTVGKRGMPWPPPSTVPASQIRLALLLHTPVSCTAQEQGNTLCLCLLEPGALSVGGDLSMSE